MIELKSTHANITLKSPSVVGGSVDLSNYYTKAQVDALIPDVSGFITGSEADTKISTAVSLAEERVDFKLGSYALKTEIPDVSGFITEIPSEYVTDAELDAKGYLTEHQSLSEYAKKSELFSKDYNDLTNKPTIPSVEGLASTQYVDNKVSEIVVPSLDGYATEQWVEGKGYLTQHQSLASYSTTTEVQSMIDTAIAGITDAEAVHY